MCISQSQIPIVSLVSSWRVFYIKPQSKVLESRWVDDRLVTVRWQVGDRSGWLVTGRWPVGDQLGAGWWPVGDHQSLVGDRSKRSVTGRGGRWPVGDGRWPGGDRLVTGWSQVDGGWVIVQLLPFPLSDEVASDYMALSHYMVHNIKQPLIKIRLGLQANTF